MTGWTSYNPYLPLMEVFGLPRSAGLSGVLGDPRIWTTLTTMVLIAAAFAVVSPHRLARLPGLPQGASLVRPRSPSPRR